MNQSLQKFKAIPHEVVDALGLQPKTVKVHSHYAILQRRRLFLDKPDISFLKRKTDGTTIMTDVKFAFVICILRLYKRIRYAK